MLLHSKLHPTKLEQGGPEACQGFDTVLERAQVTCCGFSSWSAPCALGLLVSRVQKTRSERRDGLNFRETVIMSASQALNCSAVAQHDQYSFREFA